MDSSATCDFSASNMKGDMSQRNTTKGQRFHSQTQGDERISSHTYILVAILVLIVIVIRSFAVRDCLICVIILSFILNRIISNKGKDINFDLSVKKMCDKM